MFVRLSKALVPAALSLAFAIVGFGQTPSPTPAVTPAATPVPLPAAGGNTAKGAPKIETAEQVAESVVFFYGFPGYMTNPVGRERLNQIRKTTVERGRTSFTAADGKVESASYQRFVIRADNLGKERIRLDQEFPSARYSLVMAEGKTYGVFNNTIFQPRDDAAKSFENNIFRGLEGLLRYKESESKLELQPREKLMGVDYYVLDVIDKGERRTRYYISVKSLRVMMLTFEEAGIKYRRRYYDYNYAQGTLVPYRSVLWANDKIIEETDVGTITFGQKVDEGLFASGQV